MSRSYATGTTVAATRTEAEIKDLLSSRGVRKIATFQDDAQMIYTIAFEYEAVAFKLSLPLPDPDHERFRFHTKGQRSDTAAQAEYEKELNRRWRAFGAVIKAKVIAVEEGISTMQSEFIGNALMSSGQTVAETYAPQLSALAQGGHLPALSIGGGR